MLQDDLPTYEDERIACPSCRFNLTGLLSERCPECGEPFERKELLASRPLPPRGVPIWDNDAYGSRSVRFFLTMAFVIFRPGGFAHSLPAYPDCKSARRFSRWCFALSACLMILPACFKPEVTTQFMPTWVSLLISSLICQLMISTALFEGMKPQALAVPLSTPFSETLGCMFAAFLPITSFAVGAIEMFLVFNPSYITSGRIGTIIAFFATIVLWWAVGLGLATYALDNRLSQFVGALCTIPFIMLVAGLIGVFAGIMLDLVVRGLF